MRVGMPSAGEAIQNLSFRCNGKPLADVFAGANVVEYPSYFRIAISKLRAGDVVDAFWHDGGGTLAKLDWSLAYLKPEDHRSANNGLWSHQL
jgi:hypothetical protein